MISLFKIKEVKVESGCTYKFEAMKLWKPHPTCGHWTFGSVKIGFSDKQQCHYVGRVEGKEPRKAQFSEFAPPKTPSLPQGITSSTGSGSFYHSPGVHCISV